MNNQRTAGITKGNRKDTCDYKETVQKAMNPKRNSIKQESRKT